MVDVTPQTRVTGTSDEAMYLYYCELMMSAKEIADLNEKEMGTDYEFERITTHVLPFAEAHRLINNSNALLLNYLYLAKIKDFELMPQL